MTAVIGCIKNDNIRIELGIYKRLNDIISSVKLSTGDTSGEWFPRRILDKEGREVREDLVLKDECCLYSTEIVTDYQHAGDNDVVIKLHIGLHNIFSYPLIYIFPAHIIKLLFIITSLNYHGIFWSCLTARCWYIWKIFATKNVSSD